MNIELLQHFLAVVERGSYAKAAPALGLEESALSRQMVRLADELDVKLFLPHKPGPHGPQLSPAGKLLLAKAPELLAADEAFKNEIKAVAAGHLGILSLSLGTSLNEEIVEKYISVLDSNAKDLLYEFHEGTVVEQEELILHEKAELCLTNTHIAHPSYFDILNAITMSYYVFCTKDHPLAKLKRPLKLQDLENQPLGLTHNSAPKILQAMQDLGLKVYPKIKSKVRRTSVTAARKGLCLAIFPASPNYKLPGLKSILLDEPDLQGQTILYKLKGKVLSPAAEAFQQLYCSMNGASQSPED